MNLVNFLPKKQNLSVCVLSKVICILFAPIPSYFIGCSHVFILLFYTIENLLIKKIHSKL